MQHDSMMGIQPNTHIIKQEHQASKQITSTHTTATKKQTMAAILGVQLMKHSHGLTQLELGYTIVVNQDGHEVVVAAVVNLN